MLNRPAAPPRLGASFLTKCARFAALVLLVGTAVGCGQKSDVPTVASEPTVELTAPEDCVDESFIEYDNQTSTFWHQGALFSGQMVSFYPDGAPKERIEIVNGKKQNQSTYWFSDGTLKQVATYHQGKLHGEKLVWTKDSLYTLTGQLNYRHGKAHGEQKQWYRTGELYKVLHMNMGQEKGLQQAFRKNGDLYANYEAKNGRIFGLKKAALCYGLEDEQLKSNEK